MKKAKFFPIVGFLLPTAVFFMLAISACASKPQGESLIYEVDPESVADGETVDREELTKAVERRLNSGSEKLARVQTLDDGKNKRDRSNYRVLYRQVTPRQPFVVGRLYNTGKAAKEIGTQ